MAESYRLFRRVSFRFATASALLLGLFLSIGSVQAQTVNVSISDTSVAPGDTVLVPVNVSGLDEDTVGVTAYEFEIKYGSSGVSYLGYEDSGTMSDDAGFTVSDNASIPKIGAFSADPLEDAGSSGVLIELKFKVTGSGSTEVTLDPFQFNEGSPAANPEIPTFTISSGANSAPTVVTSIPDDTVEVDAPPLTISNLDGTVFSDPDGDALTFSASSDNSAVLTASTDQGDAVLEPQATGSANVTITADDGNATVSTSLTVVVIDDQGGEEPTSQSSAVVSSSGSSDVNFGDTGVNMSFSGVSGSGTVTVEKYRSSPSDPSGISQSNVSSYRHVIEAGGSLTFDSNTEIRIDVGTLDGIDDPNNVTIYKRETVGSGSFTELTTTYDAGANVLVANVSSFSEFAFASNTESLPVEMSSFSATSDDGAAVLTWRTSSETNNAGFEIQHKTPAATQFAEAGFVEGAGTTTQPQSYRYRLDNLDFGTHTFRVRQIDSDGSSQLSRAVELDIRMTEDVHLSAPAPNPIHSSTTIRFGVQTSEHATVSVYNALGQRVATLYNGTPSGGQMRTVQFDASSLSSGQYYVRLQTPTDTRTQSLTIAR